MKRSANSGAAPGSTSALRTHIPRTHPGTARAESGGTAHLWNQRRALGNARGLQSVEAFPQRGPEQTQGWPRAAEAFDDDFPLLSLASSSHILVAFLIIYRRNIYSPPPIGQVIDLSCTWLRHGLISPRWMTLTKGCDGTFIFWMHRSDTIATHFYSHTVGKTQIHLVFAIPGGRAECETIFISPIKRISVLLLDFLHRW